jgi:hypothetical protein
MNCATCGHRVCVCVVPGSRTPVPAAPDRVDHPAHYTSGAAKCPGCQRPIECIDVAESWGFNLGNTLKYIWRADLKGAPLEDLRKAAWYLAREIARRAVVTK